MELKIEMKAQDIEKALATMYGVDQQNVFVGTVKEYNGYGPNEREVHTAVARITIEGPEKIRKLMEAAKAKEENHE
jgi:ribosomal protein S24E